MSNFKKSIRIFNLSLLLGLFLGGLYVSSQYSYLLFHTLVEAFIVIVMSSIFFLAWNTREWMEDGYFLFIGIAFFFVAVIELVHALAYKGMNIFEGYGANLPTQLWIMARYLLSISLLVAPMWFNRRLPAWPTMFIFLGITAVSLWTIFSGHFPTCYIENVGLTDFKIISEYVITLLFAGVMFILLRNRSRFEKRVLRTIMAFLALSIGAEVLFSNYLGVYDSLNMIGHFIMLVSMIFLYDVFIRIGLKHPFDLVFRDLKHKETRLRNSESELQMLFDISPFPVVVTSPLDSRFIRVNQAGLDIFEIQGGDVQNYRILDFYVNPEDRHKLLELLDKDGKVHHALLELKSASGKRIWCLVNGIRIELNGEQGLLFTMADITELRHAQEELRYLSTHDALTGVYNRLYFETEMERLQQGRRFPVSIVMLDMDELKEINDTYGHIRGDEQLQTAANLVKSILRAEEVFARIGGDEFAILLPHAEENIAQQVVARINDQLDRYNSVHQDLPLRISIGIGVSNDKEKLHEALRRADENMYADKSIRRKKTQPREQP